MSCARACYAQLQKMPPTQNTLFKYEIGRFDHLTFDIQANILSFLFIGDLIRVQTWNRQYKQRYYSNPKQNTSYTSRIAKDNRQGDLVYHLDTLYVYPNPGHEQITTDHIVNVVESKRVNTRQNNQNVYLNRIWRINKKYITEGADLIHMINLERIILDDDLIYGGHYAPLKHQLPSRVWHLTISTVMTSEYFEIAVGPAFQNLRYLKLQFDCDWLDVISIINRCSKLCILNIEVLLDIFCPKHEMLPKIQARSLDMIIAYRKIWPGLKAKTVASNCRFVLEQGMYAGKKQVIINITDFPAQRDFFQYFIENPTVLVDESIEHVIICLPSEMAVSTGNFIHDMHTIIQLNKFPNLNKIDLYPDLFYPDTEIPRRYRYKNVEVSIEFGLRVENSDNINISYFQHIVEQTATKYIQNTFVL